MGVPQRVFRATDAPTDIQFENLRKEMDGRLESVNLALSAVMPAVISATTGAQSVTLGGNINWSFAPISFASSTASQAVTFTHALSRVPAGYVNVMFNPVQLPILPVSTGLWNSSNVIFAVASDTTTNGYRILLL